MGQKIYNGWREELEHIKRTPGAPSHIFREGKGRRGAPGRSLYLNRRITKAKRPRYHTEIHNSRIQASGRLVVNRECGKVFKYISKNRSLVRRRKIRGEGGFNH